MYVPTSRIPLSISVLSSLVLNLAFMYTPRHLPRPPTPQIRLDVYPKRLIRLPWDGNV